MYPKLCEEDKEKVIWYIEAIYEQNKTKGLFLCFSMELLGLPYKKERQTKYQVKLNKHKITSLWGNKDWDLKVLK